MPQKVDKILLYSVIIISLFGLLMIYSSSNIWAEYKFNDSFHYVKYQGIFFIIGLILMWIVSKIDYKLYYQKSNAIIITCFILLILVLIPGIGSVRNGSRSWFGIGSLGIQPSEAAKLGLIIFTSKYLSNSNKFVKSYTQGVFPILGITLLFFGLIMLQPDLGTGVILVIAIISLLFIAGVNMKFFLAGGGVGIIGIVVLIIIAPYRMDRITSFLDPWKDALGTGFQIIQSLYAVGPGGLLGLGFGNSIQKHFYLPESQRIMKSEIREMARQEILRKYDVANVEEVNVNFKNVTFSQVLVPVWSSMFYYNDKEYRVVINGYNGDI